MTIDYTHDGVASTIKASPREALKKYSRKEVALHETPKDCWLVIDGKVYDVTKWVPKHPGGSLIHVRAGQDSTYLFNSYHPLYVWKLLDQYCVGEIDASDEDLSMTNVEYLDTVKEPFYLALKERVEGYFHRNKVNPRVHSHLFIKSAVILALYLFFYYLMFFQVQNPIISSIYAIAFGYISAHIAMNIMHDGNHGAYSTWPWFSYLMGISSDLIGASSYIWRQQHIIAHHAYTNVNKFDPDIRANDVDIRRVHLEQPRHSFHAYQHIYLWPLYGLMTLKAIWFDDFQALITGKIGQGIIAKMTPLEILVFWGSKLSYVVYIVILPFLYSNYEISTMVKLYILSQLVCGWTLAILFEISHVVESATFLTVDLNKGVPTVPYGWAAMQVCASTNYNTGSTLWLHLSGGLIYQIEHHLFPGVCHMHYPSIQPIVEATCKEFNIPYKRHASFFAGVKGHFTHLKQVGLKDMDLRLAG
ncbi:hypothetical protein O6H91_01G118800 [Diphasiastrum complanatum]|uniref:Uncharacterized protein n=1 Tax=Diphasiastrum complanatum TaxID=34168 RepID=A0ACC2EVM5_DIPCM|nr:hypothetical protein O6H91_01G118800 [Diphasiastrum complanatum]